MTSAPHSRLSPTLAAALAAAGWTPNRVVDPSRELDSLRAAGFEVVEPAGAVLTSLGGLLIRIPKGVSLNEPQLEITEDIEFDAVAASEWDVVAHHLSDWVVRATEPLTPLAAITNSPIVYLIGASGNVYLSYGDLLYRVGVDIWDALESEISNAEAVAL